MMKTRLECDAFCCFVSFLRLFCFLRQVLVHVHLVVCVVLCYLYMSVLMYVCCTFLHLVCYVLIFCVCVWVACCRGRPLRFVESGSVEVKGGSPSSVREAFRSKLKAKLIKGWRRVVFFRFRFR